jgi:molybdopterin biosynthesis enzyme MoaB
MKRALLTIALLFAMTASHADDKVRIVKHVEDTAGCTVVAQMHAGLSMFAIRNLLTQAKALHADTVFITGGSGWTSDAVAYRCAK